MGFLIPQQLLFGIVLKRPKWTLEELREEVRQSGFFPPGAITRNRLLDTLRKLEKKRGVVEVKVIAGESIVITCDTAPFQERVSLALVHSQRPHHTHKRRKVHCLTEPLGHQEVEEQKSHVQVEGARKVHEGGHGVQALGDSHPDLLCSPDGHLPQETNPQEEEVQDLEEFLLQEGEAMGELLVDYF